MFYLSDDRTLLPLPLSEVKNREGGQQLRRVFFTWNNYPDLVALSGSTDPLLKEEGDGDEIPIEIDTDLPLREEDLPSAPVRDRDSLWKAYFGSIPGLKAAIIGFEVGESGTPHLQGVLMFEQQKTFKFLSRWLYKAHIEPVRDLKKSINYCRKEKDFITIGELPEFREHDHKSENYGDFMEMVLSDASFRELAIDFPYLTLRNARNVQEVRKELMRDELNSSQRKRVREEYEAL